jgi:hypothetical protein
MSSWLHCIDTVHHGKEQRKGEGREVQSTAIAAGSVSPAATAVSLTNRWI